MTCNAERTATCPATPRISQLIRNVSMARRVDGATTWRMPGAISRQPTGTRVETRSVSLRIMTARRAGWKASEDRQVWPLGPLSLASRAPVPCGLAWSVVIRSQPLPSRSRLSVSRADRSSLAALDPTSALSRPPAWPGADSRRLYLPLCGCGYGVRLMATATGSPKSRAQAVVAAI